ncbi:hypothetical protein SLA2020_400990 [Shorea laevis]
MKLVLHLLSILNALIYMNHLLFAFQSLPTAALNPTNENDRLALLAFKDRIVEDPLGILTSWNESSHFCNWTGVLCSKKHQGRVTVLNLGGQIKAGWFNTSSYWKFILLKANQPQLQQFHRRDSSTNWSFVRTKISSSLFQPFSW